MMALLYLTLVHDAKPGRGAVHSRNLLWRNARQVSKPSASSPANITPTLPKTRQWPKTDSRARVSAAAAAHLAGVPRRSILIYCRAGLVRPVVQPPHGVMEFTEEAIYTVRRIERLRTVHGLDLAWLKAMVDLLDEVERLRAEVRFLRDR